MAHGFYNNEAVASPGDDSQHIVEVDIVQANVFFDGTLNNYFNVKEADQSTKNQYGGEDTSYANDLSNVARMWEPMGKELDGPDLGVYIEGMGTTKFKADSLRGYAFGTGETGIVARAQAAIEPLKELVTEKRGKQGLPAILEINVFGFSRGAATARHFVYLLRSKEARAKQFNNNWRDVYIRVNFVGLFDTVSSEGVYYGNDVGDLGLRFGDFAARRVLHLVALDEYRENFSVTNIASARQASAIIFGASLPIGFELGIPGAHSDVGGGYNCDVGKPETENRYIPPNSTIIEGDGQSVTLPSAQPFVYAQGWYQPSQLHQDARGRWRHIRQISGDYYKVALSIMVDVAEAHTRTQYKKVDIVSKTPEIAQVQSKLRAFAKANVFGLGKPTRMDWALNEQLGDEAAKAFRNKYLHLSFNFEKTGMAPRFKDSQTLERHHEPG